MFMFIPLPRASTLSVVSIFTQKWARWSKSCQSHWHSWSTNWAFPWLLKKPKTCPFFSFSVRASLGMENQRCHCCKNHPEGSQHKGSQTWLGPHSKFLLIDSLHFTALIFKWLIFRAYLTSQNRFFLRFKKRCRLKKSWPAEIVNKWWKPRMRSKYQQRHSCCRLKKSWLAEFVKKRR